MTKTGPWGQPNWRGLGTLCQKEIQRFTKVHTQTVLAPVVTTLLFYAIFALALGGVVRQVGDVPFLEFLAPGLVIMAMAQNAFANTSSSIVISKVQGNIVDVLMPPLSPLELLVGYVSGGVARGLAVGAATLGAIWVLGMVDFIAFDIRLAHPGLVLAHAVLGSSMLALLGIAGGIWADKFDHIAAVTNFIVTPLTFLSGTFYRVTFLPHPWDQIARFNPFFYMIDGFRQGFIGQGDSPPWLGIAVLVAINALLAGLVLRMLATGYKLKP